ncbi:hypothetical protein OD91_1822 [Lutibacter sp. Hel_I_33_5]|nr:hypothetical protein OD91_1822 [Lutibacter sp. Hel_I_33_5]
MFTNISCRQKGVDILETKVNQINRLETKSKHNQIPEKWNMELYKNDKKWLKNTNSKPLNSLAFPVEKYEYYVFNEPFNFQINGFHFSGISFGENTGGKDDKFIFKHELTLIFYSGEKDYQINGDVSSRNFPYLTIQGQLKLNNIYDFIGVKSPENSGYLIVNLKSFDLKFGQTVIIFPNKDNSFYYLQSNEKPQINEDIKKYVYRLKTDKRIMKMIKLAEE